MNRIVRALAVVFVGLVAARASAQTLNECTDGLLMCAEDHHFRTDTTRYAAVSDRTLGFEFEIDYDPMDGNSEDFCPHCRLDLMVSDPGIDFAELSRVGIERSDLDSAASMTSAFQSAVAADPTGLAMMLNEGLMGAELDAAVAEIVAIQEHLTLVIAALETIELARAGTYDFESTSIETLIDALYLHVDSGFRADFSNPNDPRVHNTGVRVYGVPEFVTSLASSGVDMTTANAIGAGLGMIPGASGTIEISGDDDSAIEPVVFHGYHTDLTVRQRTYVLNGTSAFLIVFTIVNDTTRVFPLVEAAMVSDFDIPPLGYDTSTEFDPATMGVLTYDTIPYTDPEEHYWFGSAPAAIGTPSPRTFTLANWMIDKNFTLAQIGSDNTTLNRYRFFLWDPTVSGDHDDAMGKSEKTGAIGMLYTGPLMPGDEATVAFCYAAGEGSSSAAARAEYTAVMTACRALYTGITPECGNSILQFGEECEPPGTDSCSPACQRLVCGDGRRFAPEECDDGNTVDGDGCSRTCVLEVCGNGIVQAGEECDDGNIVSSDDCTTTCHAASCGDGVVRSAACTADCGCVGYQYCVSGRFTLDNYGLTRDSVFEPLRGIPIEYQIGFDIANEDRTVIAAQRGIRYTTGPMHVEMSGAPLAADLGRALDGRAMIFDVRANPARLIPRFNIQSVNSFLGRTPIGFSFLSLAATFAVDGTGFPVLDTVRATNGLARLTVNPTGTPTDYASGPSSIVVSPAPAAGSPGEACDDGNESDFDACTTACVPAVCGDAILQPGNGEECDDGVATARCDADCTLSAAALAACGDGSVPPDPGEQCDDGNTMDDDGCSSTCLTERCGDGLVQASEACDDGGNGDGDGCTDACVLEICGDSIVQPGEECDTGDARGDGADCLSSCVTALCGDGLVHDGVEACDDGNTDDLDGCSAACAVELCGDGRPGPGETCDDGNADAGDGCSAGCQTEVCGDALPGPAEQCDDGNLLDGDGCSKDCLLENLEACGDGTIGVGEQCDDGGNTSDDGCSEFCQLENPAACGNGNLDPGEQCDDANVDAGDGCSALCREERCGDGVHARGEACDDGNDTDGDGCDSSCQAEPAECGNGAQEFGEQCDDGNDDDADDCTSECMITGTAPLGDTCEDGDQDIGEQCDDGNRNEGDGCGATCQLEASVCGNGRLEYAEVCDEVSDECTDACQFVDAPPPPIEEGCGGCAVPRNRSSLAWLIALALIAWRGRARRLRSRSATDRRSGSDRRS